MRISSGMAKKKKFGDKYASMTVIGKQVGLSSREVGKKLKEIGLREQNGEPTKEALDSGLAVSTPLKEGTKHYMWDRGAVVKKLGASGMVDTSPEAKRFFHVKRVAQEALDMVRFDENDPMADKLARFGADVAMDEELPKIDDDIVGDMVTVRKAIHQARGPEVDKEWLLEYVLDRRVELSRERKEDISEEDISYIVERSKDWRTLESVMALPRCPIDSSEKALQKMESLGAPPAAMGRAKSRVAQAFAEHFSDRTGLPVESDIEVEGNAEAE